MERNKIPALASVLLAGFLVGCSPSSMRHEYPGTESPITLQPTTGATPLTFDIAPRPSITPGGKVISYCSSMAIRMERLNGKTEFGIKPQLAPPLKNENVLILGAITAITEGPERPVSTTFNLRSETPITIASQADSFKVEVAVNDGINGGAPEWRKDGQHEAYQTGAFINICPTAVTTIGHTTLNVAKDWQNTLPVFLISRLHPLAE